MSIKITLGQIVAAFDPPFPGGPSAVGNVSALIPPGRYHFRVAKLIDAAQKDYQGYMKQRQELFKKYGVPQMMMKEGKEVPTGNLTLAGATPENIQAFNDALMSLLEEETTIPYEPIIYTKLGIDEDEKSEIPCPHCTKPVKLPPVQKGLSINDVRALGPLLVEDEAAAAAVATAPAAAPTKPELVK
jgi:hypothetical protein